MKIELDFPYSADWRNGYLVKDVDGRNKVVLFNTNSDRTSTLYSRYLLACHIGRYLTENEQADHIDENPFNDEVSNLQILSRSENIAKQNRLRKAPDLVYICEQCQEPFLVPNRNRNKGIRFCCRQCLYDSMRKK